VMDAAAPRGAGCGGGEMTIIKYQKTQTTSLTNSIRPIGHSAFIRPSSYFEPDCIDDCDVEASVAHTSPSFVSDPCSQAIGQIRSSHT
jgi:hypothetical protein